MKKVIKMFGILFVLLILIIIIVPFFFKSQITDLVKNEANKNLNATLNFSDVGLNLVSSFPNLSLSLDDLSIVNKAPFEGDTIFSSSEINASIDLMSLISGDKIKINSFKLIDPKVMVYILKDSSANYNITKESGAVAEDTVTSVKGEQKNFSIGINSYSIKNGNIAFIDQTSNIIFAVKGLNHSGEGDISQDKFLLNTNTNINELTLQMDNIKYLNRVKASLKMDLDVNLKEMKFHFKENQLKINNLALNLDGGVELPNNKKYVDIKFNSPKSDFKDFLSLIPAIYKNDFSSLKADGKFEFNGKLKGKISEDLIPTFSFNLLVNNADFSYPELPTPVNNVNLDMTVDNADGNLNSTVVDLKKLHLELGKDPFDAKLKMSNLQKDPYVSAQVKGTINLDNIKNAIQIPNITELSGVINTDISFKGNLQSAKTNYENLDASGNLSVKNLKYKSTDFPEGVNIFNSNLKFSPKKVELTNFDSKIGESDIHANGDLNNFISYVLTDATLIGKLNVNSNYLNLNPFMTQSANDNIQNKNTDTMKVEAVNIPGNINFVMKSNVKKLIYDNLEITKFVGNLTIKDSKINMENLSMNMLDGTLKGNGYYAKSENQEKPEIKFSLNISNFDINQTYNKFISVKQLAPIAKYIQGKFSSGLTLTTDLNNNLVPDYDTFNGNGQLDIVSAEIKNFKPFTTLGSMLNLNALSNPNVKNVNPKFKIEEGKFYIFPVKYKVGNYDVSLSGYSSIDQSINYEMDIDVPASGIKKTANSAISSLLKKDINLVKSDKVKVKAFITGTIDSPNIKTSASDIAKNVASSVVEEVKQQVVDKAKAKADSIKTAAENKLKEEAKKQEEAAKKKAEEAKKKLEEEAKKKLKNLFKFK